MGSYSLGTGWARMMTGGHELTCWEYRGKKALGNRESCTTPPSDLKPNRTWLSLADAHVCQCSLPGLFV